MKILLQLDTWSVDLDVWPTIPPGMRAARIWFAAPDGTIGLGSQGRRWARPLQWSIEGWTGVDRLNPGRRGRR